MGAEMKHKIEKMISWWERDANNSQAIVAIPILFVACIVKWFIDIFEETWVSGSDK